MLRCDQFNANPLTNFVPITIGEPSNNAYLTL
jgi:hypothetical protein